MRNDALLRTTITLFALSVQASHRVLKIARTIADLDGAADLEPKHVSEAISIAASIGEDWPDLCYKVKL